MAGLHRKTETTLGLAPRISKPTCVVILSVMLLAWCTNAEQPVAAQSGLTPYDVARLRLVTEAQISPDGRFIAYVVSVPRRIGREDDGPAWSELHVWDIEQGRSRPFIVGPVQINQCRWTPDSAAIAFLAKRAGDKETSLYLIPRDGGESRRVVALKTSITQFAIHPSGRTVLALAPIPKPEERRKLEEKGFNAQIFEEQQPPVAIWQADLDPDTEDEPQRWELPGSWSEISWSPDGERVVAAVAPSSRIDDFMMFRRLRVINAATRQIEVVIDNPGKLGAVHWSPDGRHIAFLSGEDLHDPSEGRLMLADASTGTFQQWLPDYTPNVASFAWLDERTVVFLADDGCLSALGTVTLESRQPRLLREPTVPIFAGVSLSRASRRIATVGHTDKHPAELFLVELDRPDQPQRCTDLNPWLQQRRLAAQQIVRYRASDGETIEGILVRPLEENPQQRYPLIVAVHGGPESHVSHGWVTSYSNPGQMAAALGMFVFYPNYRGSTGRGVAFAKAHQGDYGGREFDDIVDGVKYLIEQDRVDPKKVGITGGSYGGFATAWCATYHSQHFAAGVMFVGISNQVSKPGTTDIPEEMYLVHSRKRLWDDWNFFLQRSPIYYAPQCRTPLLILHGREDTRVHPSQSMELYRHLKTLGQAPVRLVYYPGEGHGNRKAAARLDYSLRMLQWFQHYLLGPGGAPPPGDIDYQLETLSQEK